MQLAAPRLPGPGSLLARAGPVAILLLAVAGWSAAFVFDGFNDVDSQIERSDAVWALSFLAPVVVGAFLARRLPANPVGWLLALGPALVGVSIAQFEYVDAAPYQGWPAAWLAVPGANATFTLGPALLGAALLVFPDGRLPGPRWRWPVRAVAVIVAITTLAGLFVPTVGVPPTAVDNPLALPLGGVTELLSGAGAPAGGLFYLLALVGGVRRAVVGDGTVRRQLLGLVYPLAVGALLLVCLVAVDVVGTVPSWAVVVLVTVVNVGVATGIAVAVTRYRLYELDRLVSRTLAYTAVVVLLAAIYTGSVITLQLVLQGVTQESDVAVALSTVLAAAAFQPLRRRIQHRLDRRFDRRRYDAQQTVREFGALLRDDLATSRIAARLSEAVVATVAPRSVGVWLPAELSGPPARQAAVRR